MQSETREEKTHLETTRRNSQFITKVAKLSSATRSSCWMDFLPSESIHSHLSVGTSSNCILHHLREEHEKKILMCLVELVDFVLEREE